jgi:hypothetical protein
MRPSSNVRRRGLALSRPQGFSRSRVLSLACALGVVVTSASCSRDPEIDERAVVVFAPRACPISEADAFSVIYGGGDFEPSRDQPPTASFFLRDIGKRMDTLPRETRSLVVDVSQRDSAWRGLTDIPAQGPINVLVWPGARPCRLTRDVEPRTDMALGVFGHHVMVAGGRSSDGLQVPHTYVGDLTTGAIERLEFGLNTRRSWPTITAFRAPSSDRAGAGAVPALVAGGEDPDSRMPIATAEIYVPNIAAPSNVGDFDRQRIDLSEPRTRHGAVVLATGESLLVGGAGNAGVLRTMEIVAPANRRAHTAGVALLEVGRRDPTVLRLASGEILVAGGVSATAEPIAKLEWFAPDASHQTKRSIDLVTGRERAIVPLDAGGALAVILPAADAPNFKDFPTVWVISADGTLEPGTPVDPTTLDMVRLFPGADGAPILWTGRRWLRWSPWLARFQPIAGSPETGPSLAATASGDSGLALWLDDRAESGMNVTGFRFATSTRYDAVPKPLLVTGLDLLAPDRLPSESTIRFELERGAVLGPRATVFLTNVTFADFDAEVDVTAAAPYVVLRLDSGSELEVGGAACAFAQAATNHLSIRRRGQRVDVRVDSASFRSCPTELERGDGRVALGVRGSQGVGFSGARQLVVTRR